MKNIFITGTSSGIGKAIAEYLSDKGYSVIGTSRKKALINPKFETIELDVTDDHSVLSAYDTVLKKLGKIHVIINNAGYGITGAIEDHTIREAKDQFETNYFGVVRVTQQFLPHFRENNEGLIINISSIGGLISLPFEAHYSASKYALEAFTEALRFEIRPFNISVCNINPGDFKTAFSENRKTTETINIAYQEKVKQFLSLYESGEKKGSDPIEIARLVERIILNPKKAKIRYLAGNFSQTSSVFIKSIVGDNCFEKILRKVWKA